MYKMRTEIKPERYNLIGIQYNKRNYIQRLSLDNAFYLFFFVDFIKKN